MVKTKSSVPFPEMVIEDGVEDLNEALEVIPYDFEITAYGADYPVDSMVDRMSRDDIVVPTYDPEVKGKSSKIMGFQRRFIWTRPQSDRFIESLLLGLPVPGIFLVREPDNTLLVLDGQQRLRSLHGFYRGILRGEEFRLESVQERYRGKAYEDLEEEDRRRLDNSIIHATIVRQDQPSKDWSSVYILFERLNTGGTNLQPQEIRVALYRGRFAALLRELNDVEDWRAIYGNRSERLKDQELILRFFALLFAASKYERPMKGFLNKYMATNRNISRKKMDDFRAAFEATVDLVRTTLGDRPFRLATALNAAVYDSVMVGLARRLASDKKVSEPESVRGAYEKLIANKKYLATVERATADEESVRTRLEMARKAFSSVT